MRINVKECTDHISIGKTGENIITEVVFPDYEGFSAALTYQRPGETPYPIALTRAEGGWLWTVTNTELAVPGWGWSEVVYTEGEAVKLSKTYRVVIGESLEPAGEVPSGWESYYEDIIEAGNNAQTAAGEAKASSANAEQSEVNAAGSAVVAQSYAQTASEKATDAIAYARSAASSATSAKERADLADGFAKVAQSAATEALTSATNASASASQSAASASAADVSRATAEAAAAQAQASAEQAAQTAQSIEGALDDYSTTTEMDAAIAEGVAEAKTYTDESIIKLLPTDTASGAVASFPDGADDVPMLALNVAVEPVQDLHGYDAPWPAGGGKNLFEVTLQSGTVNNVTFTIENGKITIQGTASSNIGIANIFGTVSLPAGVYKANGFDGGAANSTRMVVRNMTTETNITQIYQERDVSFTLNDAAVIGIYIIIPSGVTVNDVLYPMLRKEGESADYAPYENICPISGWTAVGVNVNGTTITHEFRDAQGNTLTVYGGEDDLVGGKLRVTHSYRLLTGAETWIYNANYSGFRLTLTDAAILGIPSDDLTSNMFKGARRRGVGDVRPPGLMLVYTGTSAVDGRYVFFTTDITTKEEWRAWLAENPVQLVYPLAAPLEYDLTPTDIRTLYGDNTIFADCGDVSVTYKADVQKWVEKKLAE